MDKRTIAYWSSTGFITPSVQEAEGKGSKRLYSFKDVVLLRVASQLRDMGMSLQSLRRVILHLQQNLGEVNLSPETYLITDGHTAQIQVGGENLIRILQSSEHSGIPWVVLNLEQVTQELKYILGSVKIIPNRKWYDNRKARVHQS